MQRAAISEPVEEGMRVRGQGVKVIVSGDEDTIDMLTCVNRAGKSAISLCGPE